MNYSDFVQSRIKWLDTDAADILHMAVGIMGEVIEMKTATSRKNFKEEFGDIEFYFNGALQIITKLGLPTYDSDVSAPEDIPHAWGILEIAAADFLDMAKKAFIYNKPMEKMHWGHCFTHIEFSLDFLAEIHGVERWKIRADNQTKLEERYPLGYSDAAAQARADKPLGE